MRRILLVILAALAVAGPAKAWTWPASGPVLLPYSFDPDHPYGAGQHRGIDVGGGCGRNDPRAGGRRRSRSPAPFPEAASRSRSSRRTGGR